MADIISPKGAFESIHQSLQISEHIQAEILPHPLQSILEFSAFQYPIISLSTAVSDISLFLGTQQPTVIDSNVIYRIPLPGKATVKALVQSMCQIVLTSPDTMPSLIVVIHISSTQQQTLPPWVITYWTEIIELHTYWSAWAEVLADLCQHEQLWAAGERQMLIKQIFDILALLPWSGKVQGFDNPEPIHTLSAYILHMKWLSDTHENQLLDLLHNDLHQSQDGSRIVVENLDFIKKMKEAYKTWDAGEYENSNYFRHLQGIGDVLASGEKDLLGTLTNINGVHWVALTFNFRKQSIIFGDSLSSDSSPSELQFAADWWTWHHTRESFNHVTMSITHQLDGFSCEILSFNAFANLLCPKKYPVTRCADVDNERLHMFLHVTDCHLDQVSML